MKITHLLIVALILPFQQGCASLFTGGSQQVSVRSEPTGAKVVIGPYEGTAPCTFTVPAGKSYVIQAKYQGEQKTQPLERGIQPVTFLNIFFWPGFLIDLGTGKIWVYDPTNYLFTFEKTDSGRGP